MSNNHLPGSSGLQPGCDMVSKFCISCSRGSLFLQGGHQNTQQTLSGKFVNCYNIKRQARFELPGCDSSVEFWSHSLHKPSGASLWHFVIDSESQVELEPIIHQCPPLLSMDGIIPHHGSHAVAIRQPFQFENHLPKQMFFFGDYHYKLMF